MNFPNNFSQIKELQGIYSITNKITKKIYIGSTINFRIRFTNHLSQLRNNRHSAKYLQNSFKIHGENNFEFKILEIVDNRDNLLIREKYYLDTFKPYDLSVGYNCYKTPGAIQKPHGKSPAFEQCFKMSMFRKDQKRFLTPDKLVEITTHLRNINLGVPKSQETKDKIAKTLKLRNIINNDNRVPIVQLDLDGHFIKDWACAKQASEFLGLSRPNITGCCRKRKYCSTVGGFRWVYKKDYIPLLES